MKIVMIFETHEEMDLFWNSAEPILIDLLSKHGVVYDVEEEDEKYDEYDEFIRLFGPDFDTYKRADADGYDYI